MPVKIQNITLGDTPLLLAPMEDVSDPPFRSICKTLGADLMYTEFVSSEGLIRDATKSKKKLDIFENERPIGIQIFGGDESAMRNAAIIAEKVKPDLIDINYGCPVKKVTCKGAGASLLQDVDKMVRLTKAVVDAVEVPVTVKTRLGWDEQSKNILEVAERLQNVKIKALTIHGRTRSQLYKGDADWTLIKEIKENPNIEIPIFGNGDIDSPEKAKDYLERYKVDGLMVGRASIGNPWVFREIKHYLKHGTKLPPPTISERFLICKTHLTSSVEWKGERTGVVEMRRHYAKYFKGLPDIKTLRNTLVTMDKYEDILEFLKVSEQEFTYPNTLNQPTI